MKTSHDVLKGSRIKIWPTPTTKKPIPTEVMARAIALKGKRRTIGIHQRLKTDPIEDLEIISLWKNQGQDSFFSPDSEYLTIGIKAWKKDWEPFTDFTMPTHSI